MPAAARNGRSSRVDRGFPLGAERALERAPQDRSFRTLNVQMISRLACTESRISDFSVRASIAVNGLPKAVLLLLPGSTLRWYDAPRSASERALARDSNLPQTPAQSGWNPPVDRTGFGKKVN